MLAERCFPPIHWWLKGSTALEIAACNGLVVFEHVVVDLYLLSSLSSHGFPEVMEQVFLGCVKGEVKVFSWQT